MTVEDPLTTEANEIITEAQKDESWFDRFLAFLFDPAVVGVVRSSSASEANVDDYDLMRYYASHPETELDESLTESV